METKTHPTPCSLAVMDAAISDPDNTDTNDLVWARAAVAELVAAARAELESDDDNGAARERLAAALAKFNPGA